MNMTWKPAHALHSVCADFHAACTSRASTTLPTQRPARSEDVAVAIRGFQIIWNFLRIIEIQGSVKKSIKIQTPKFIGFKNLKIIQKIHPKPENYSLVAMATIT